VGTAQDGQSVRGSLFGEHDFRLILIAWGGSMLGDSLAVVALMLRVQGDTGSGFAVAGLLLASGLPAVALNPLAGWIVDRFETTRVLAIAALFQAAAAVGLALVDSLAATIALAGALGCGAAVERPALFALLPRAVGEERAPPAMGWLEAVRYGGLTLGLLFGGILTATLGASSALLVDAGTFLLAAGCAVALRTRRRPDRYDDGDESGRMSAGMRLLAADPILRTSVLVLCAAVGFAAIVNVAEVFYAKDELGAGDAGFGALAASWGVGMSVGALTSGRWLSGANAARAVVLATLGSGVVLLLAAPAPTLVFALVCFVFGGAFNGIENVAMRVLVQARVADHLRGRVYSAYQGGITAANFMAIAAGGAVVELSSPRGTFAAAGIGALAAGAIGSVLFVRIERRQPERV
jgi:predicted MFS family arabinose efflux permease